MKRRPTRRPPRRIFVRSTTYDALRTRIGDAPIGPTVDVLVTKWLEEQREQN